MNDEYKGTVRRDDSDTPETDAAAWQGHCGDLDWQEVVNADVARRLEREKNTCKYHLEDLQERITNELDQIISLTVELGKARDANEEQAALLGKGGEREARLKTENDQLREAIKNWFKVEGRHNSQIAAAKMAELVGLPANYPENYKK